MKIQNNITIFTGDTRNNAQAEKAKENQASDGKNKAIYAGNLLTEAPLRDRLQQRKAQAQQRAMKIIGDAWDGDRKIDGLVKEREEHLRNFQATYKAAQDRMVEIREESDALRKTYGVDADSEEQRDLDLLLKAQAAAWPIPGEQLTEEERERLHQYELQGKELTEYQERQLKLNEEIGQLQLVAHIAEYGSIDSTGIRGENYIIRGIREEQRKVHPMADAKKQAEEIMEAARDEAIGMIVDEARDRIDQEQEKKEEEAEVIKEKKEEQAEILEKRKEREDEMEELMEDVLLDEPADLRNVQTEIQQEIQNIVSKADLAAEEIKNMVSKMNLMADDLKGAKVDAIL